MGRRNALQAIHVGIVTLSLHQNREGPVQFRQAGVTVFRGMATRRD